MAVSGVRALLLALSGGAAIAAVAVLFPQCLGGPYAGLSPYLRDIWLTSIPSRIGLVPPVGEAGIETEGLDVTDEQMHKLLAVSPAEWREQHKAIEEHYAKFGDRMPRALREQLEQLGRRLER